MILFSFIIPCCAAACPYQQHTQKFGKKLNFKEQTFTIKPISVIWEGGFTFHKIYASENLYPLSICFSNFHPTKDQVSRTCKMINFSPLKGFVKKYRNSETCSKVQMN